MTKVYYTVGKTTCNTLAEAVELQSKNPRATIKTCYEKIEEPRVELSEIRKAWLTNH